MNDCRALQNVNRTRLIGQLHSLLGALVAYRTNLAASAALN